MNNTPSEVSSSSAHVELSAVLPSPPQAMLTRNERATFAAAPEYTKRSRRSSTSVDHLPVTPSKNTGTGLADTAKSYQMEFEEGTFGTAATPIAEAHVPGRDRV